VAFESHPNEQITVDRGGDAAVLVIVALVGCHTPARRPMGVDPVVALRHY
jgi:hypothetical protein